MPVFVCAIPLLTETKAYRLVQFELPLEPHQQPFASLFNALSELVFKATITTKLLKSDNVCIINSVWLLARSNELMSRCYVIIPN